MTSRSLDTQPTDPASGPESMSSLLPGIPATLGPITVERVEEQAKTLLFGSDGVLSPLEVGERDSSGESGSALLESVGRTGGPSEQVTGHGGSQKSQSPHTAVRDGPGMGNVEGGEENPEGGGGGGAGRGVAPPPATTPLATGGSQSTSDTQVTGKPRAVHQVEDDVKSSGDEFEDAADIFLTSEPAAGSPGEKGQGAKPDLANKAEDQTTVVEQKPVKSKMEGSCVPASNTVAPGGQSSEVPGTLADVQHTGNEGKAGEALHQTGKGDHSMNLGMNSEAGGAPALEEISKVEAMRAGGETGGDYVTGKPKDLGPDQGQPEAAVMIGSKGGTPTKSEGNQAGGKLVPPVDSTKVDAGEEMQAAQISGSQNNTTPASTHREPESAKVTSPAPVNQTPAASISIECKPSDKERVTDSSEAVVVSGKSAGAIVDDRTSAEGAADANRPNSTGNLPEGRPQSKPSAEAGQVSGQSESDQTGVRMVEGSNTEGTSEKVVSGTPPLEPEGQSPTAATALKVKERSDMSLRKPAKGASSNEDIPLAKGTYTMDFLDKGDDDFNPFVSRSKIAVTPPKGGGHLSGDTPPSPPLCSKIQPAVIMIRSPGEGATGISDMKNERSVYHITEHDASPTKPCHPLKDEQMKGDTEHQGNSKAMATKMEADADTVTKDKNQNTVGFAAEENQKDNVNVRPDEFPNRTVVEARKITGKVNASLAEVPAQPKASAETEGGMLEQKVIDDEAKSDSEKAGIIEKKALPFLVEPGTQHVMVAPADGGGTSSGHPKVNPVVKSTAGKVCVLPEGNGGVRLGHQEGVTNSNSQVGIVG